MYSMHIFIRCGISPVVLELVCGSVTALVDCPASLRGEDLWYVLQAFLFTLPKSLSILWFARWIETSNQRSFLE
jgi:hypothetical protein